MHICVIKLTIIGSDNGLSPGRSQAIIWTSAGILLIGILGTNFSEILSEIQAFSFKKTRLKMWSAKWLPSCLGLIELILSYLHHQIFCTDEILKSLQWTLGDTRILSIIHNGIWLFWPCVENNLIITMSASHPVGKTELLSWLNCYPCVKSHICDIDYRKYVWPCYP